MIPNQGNVSGLSPSPAVAPTPRSRGGASDKGPATQREGVSTVGVFLAVFRVVSRHGVRRHRRSLSAVGGARAERSPFFGESPSLCKYCGYIPSPIEANRPQVREQATAAAVTAVTAATAAATASQCNCRAWPYTTKLAMKYAGNKAHKHAKKKKKKAG